MIIVALFNYSLSTVDAVKHQKAGDSEQQLRRT
jgi:hypothetical protein